MPPRDRDEQEMRNGVEVMTWIEHLTAHPDVPLVDEDRDTYIATLHRADAGDLAEWIICLTQAISRAMIKAELLKKIGPI